MSRPASRRRPAARARRRLPPFSPRCALSRRGVQQRSLPAFDFSGALCLKSRRPQAPLPLDFPSLASLNTYRAGPDERGHFGRFGGRFVAETLMPLILEVERAYTAARQDPAFAAE